MREKRLSLNAAKQGRTAGWNPGEWGTGRVGGRGKHGRWGILKGCEPVEIGGGGGWGEIRDKAQYFAIDKRVILRKPRKKGAGAGNARYGKWGFGRPCPPSPTTIADGY